MKWFKHFTDASDDDFLQTIEDIFGLEGYARWWKLLEVIAGQISEKHPEPSAEFTWQKWGEKLRAKPSKLKTFLEHSENKTKIKLEQNGILLKITCFKLLELKDNHTRNLQATDKRFPEKFPLDIEEEEERKNKPLPLKREKLIFEVQEEKLTPRQAGVNLRAKGINPRNLGTNPKAIAEKENQITDSEKAYHMKYRRDRFGHILDTTAERWLKDYETKNGVIDLGKKAKG